MPLQESIAFPALEEQSPRESELTAGSRPQRCRTDSVIRFTSSELPDSPGEGYTCYLRVIPEYAEKGETLTSLKDNGDKNLQEIMEKYALTNINEHNGIEYAINMVETLESGVVLLDLTVFDGNPIAMAYSFDGDHLSEATAFRNYILSSIFPIKAND